MTKLNGEPPPKLLAWAPCYAGEPREGQRSSVTISVWVPAELAQWEQDHCWDSGHCRLTRLAAYLREHLGFVVRVTQGWGSHWSASAPEDLMCVSVPVGVKQVRDAAPGPVREREGDSGE